MARIFKEVLTEAGGTHLIRGFATNVSNYSPLVEPDKSIQNQSGPYFNWNPAMDELTYVSLLRRDFEAEGIYNRDFIIDTGRNGNPRSRAVWGNWCNILYPAGNFSQREEDSHEVRRVRNVKDTCEEYFQSPINNHNHRAERIRDKTKSEIQKAGVLGNDPGPETSHDC
jgi:hypothetical protein